MKSTIQLQSVTIIRNSIIINIKILIYTKLNKNKIVYQVGFIINEFQFFSVSIHISFIQNLWTPNNVSNNRGINEENTINMRWDVFSHKTVNIAAKNIDMQLSLLCCPGVLLVNT